MGGYGDQGWRKDGQDKNKTKGQQPKNVDCGTMLVNWGSRAGWKKVAHPMDRTANWCCHGG